MAGEEEMCKPHIPAPNTKPWWGTDLPSLGFPPTPAFPQHRGPQEEGEQW